MVNRNREPAPNKAKAILSDNKDLACDLLMQGQLI